MSNLFERDRGATVGTGEMSLGAGSLAGAVPERELVASCRTGDPEIYRMWPDGSEVTRLTDAMGYDGGAFFSFDGSQIVWRADRPKGEDEEEKYRKLREPNEFSPTTLDLWVMNADGTNPRRITDNGAANFGPFFHPDGRRIIFVSNMHDPKGRDFDLYLINLDHQMIFNSFKGFFLQSGGWYGIGIYLILGVHFLLFQNRTRENSHAILITLAILTAQFIGYYLFYLISPYDLNWHIGYSLSRLFVHAYPTTVFMVLTATQTPETVFSSNLE